MFKVTFAICVCVISLNLSGQTDSKPIVGLQPSEHPEVTTIQIPRSIISREELVALAQYVMRMMASRINITLQATASHTDFPRHADPVKINSGAAHSTTPTVISSTYYETPGNTKKINHESTQNADQKLENPCKKIQGAENRGSLVQDPGVTNSRKTFTHNGPRLTINGRPSLTYEPFVRYAERNIEAFPNRFDFETIPNSEISPTYIPQLEKSTAVLPLMEQIVNSPLLSSGIPISPVTAEKDFRSPNIRIRNLTIERVPPSQSGNAVVSVPFEAVITFTRQKPLSPKLEVEDQNIDVIPTRDPPDDFPPYFETVLPIRKKTSASKNGSLSLNPENNLSPSGEAVNEVVVDQKDQVLKPMKKRQTPRVGELLEMLGLSTKRTKGSRKGSALTPPPSSQITVEPFRNLKSQKLPVTTLKENTTTPPKGGPMFQRQEFDEDEEEEEEGSLGSITDILPLVLPILEDLSDPNTETDIAELLQAGIPLVQGISQGDGETDGIDLVGIATPILASLSGPNRNGNGTVLQAILPLVLPLVTPFIGPIVGPIIQASSSPADQGGSSITPLIQAVAGPLSLPTQPGGISIASSLISGIIASLSKDLKAGSNGGSDIGALVSTLVSGVIAGGSAGVSAKFMKPPPPQAPPGYAPYGQAPVPASSVDTLELVGTSFKEILGLTLQLVKSVISSVTGILGASSAEQPRPVYGPAKANSRIT